MSNELLFLGGAIVGAILGSLTEYWVHILMHRRILLSRTHFNHHREPEDDSWFKQFAYYGLGSVPLLAVVAYITWLFGWEWAGIGLAFGSIGWSAWVAYAHNLQHTRPELVFWMPQPVHHLHHAFEMNQHNFGLSIDIWDRVFGTYKSVEWTPAPRPRYWPLHLLLIRWF
jgi:sterol desaturase/sphingolipid hydroxylase (fatty acid hydroxylase superfamily)